MTVAIVLRRVTSPKLEPRELCLQNRRVLLLLRGRRGRIEGCQGERLQEMIGGLDRHGHHGTNQRFCLHCEAERLFEPPIEEGEHLLHDVIKDDAATEISLDEGCETVHFPKGVIVQGRQTPGPALEAGHEMLLEPYCLAYRVVVTLLRERRVLDR